MPRLLVATAAVMVALVALAQDRSPMVDLVDMPVVAHHLRTAGVPEQELRDLLVSSRDLPADKLVQAMRAIRDEVETLGVRRGVGKAARAAVDKGLEGDALREAVHVYLAGVRNPDGAGKAKAATEPLRPSDQEPQEAAQEEAP